MKNLTKQYCNKTVNEVKNITRIFNKCLKNTWAAYVQKLFVFCLAVFLLKKINVAYMKLFRFEKNKQSNPQVSSSVHFVAWKQELEFMFNPGNRVWKLCTANFHLVVIQLLLV